MDNTEKKRLKKLGKQIVEKRAADLRAKLASTNPAPFASDEFLRNEIAIRDKERQLRKEQRVFSQEEIVADFVFVRWISICPSGIPAATTTSGNVVNAAMSCRLSPFASYNVNVET